MARQIQIRWIRTADLAHADLIFGWLSFSPPPPAPRIRGMRRFTIRFVNPITRRFVHHLPGFCLLIYRGRKSGKTYRIPMNVFHRSGQSSCIQDTAGRWVSAISIAARTLNRCPFPSSAR
jgi:hypothetical protein